VSVGYHGVDDVRLEDDPENLCVAPERFRRQLDLLLDAGFEVVTVAELAERAAGGPPPPGLAALSFDDGMESNHRVVLPMLREAGVAATVYVVSGWIGEPHPHLRDGSRLMTADELREMARAGIELGSHSVTHPDLTTVSAEECNREVADSVAAIEELSGRTVRTFAYPYCRYDDAAVAAVRRARLSAAVTCEGRGDWTPHRMKRAVVTSKDGLPSFVAKLADLYQPAFESGPGRLLRSATRDARGRARRRRA
jgi:peptidoglycan/xylan/chitin deacetylase (PgdA/CDA1 family)